MLQKNTIDKNTLELLKSLQNDELLQNFNLAGGTSLALQIGHRRSIDLDLFTRTDFNETALSEHLEQNFNFKTDSVAKNTLKGT